jgi:hypothetical protein
LLLEGSRHFSADAFPPEECSQQVKEALACGNHKGVVKTPAKLFDLLDNNATHGSNMPLPLSTACHIPGLLMSPMNVARQNTIDELGNIVPRDHLTRDPLMFFFLGHLSTQDLVLKTMNDVTLAMHSAVSSMSWSTSASSTQHGASS